MKAHHPCIYLDYAATTPVDPAVIQAMNHCMSFDGSFGNAASVYHPFGWDSAELIDGAKVQVAKLIGAAPSELVFTSGATESINLALKGLALHSDNSKRHIITSATEHKAVLDVCAFLEQKGFSITYLTPDQQGTISKDQVLSVIRDDTLLVSLMHVNNETGVIQNITEIGDLCRSRSVLVHVDAAQSAGKLNIDVNASNIDLLSLSAHKFYGPKGVGALFVRKEVHSLLMPLIHGGGHQKGMRSGTLPTQQIVGLGKACEIAMERMDADLNITQAHYDRVVDAVSGLSGVIINGDQDRHYPGILNLSFPGRDSEELMMRLKRFAVSSGSACSSADRKPSHVLLAMGCLHDVAHSSLRISFGRYTSDEDVEHLIQALSALFL